MIDDPGLNRLLAAAQGYQPDPLNVGRAPGQQLGSRCYSSRPEDTSTVELRTPADLDALDALSPDQLPEGLTVIEASISTAAVKYDRHRPGAVKVDAVEPEPTPPRPRAHREKVKSNARPRRRPERGHRRRARTRS